MHQKVFHDVLEPDAVTAVYSHSVRALGMEVQDNKFGEVPQKSPQAFGPLKQAYFSC